MILKSLFSGEYHCELDDIREYRDDGISWRPGLDEQAVEFLTPMTSTTGQTNQCISTPYSKKELEEMIENEKFNQQFEEKLK